MKGFQVKAKRNLFSNTNFSKFIAIQKSEIKLLKNSNKKEILPLKVMLETILFRLKTKINNYKLEWKQMEVLKKIKINQNWRRVIAFNKRKILLMPIRFKTKTIFTIIFWSNNSTFNRGMNIIRKEIKLKQHTLLQGQVNKVKGYCQLLQTKLKKLMKKNHLNPTKLLIFYHKGWTQITVSWNQKILIVHSGKTKVREYSQRLQ